jgi:hypothetical protein
VHGSAPGAALKLPLFFPRNSRVTPWQLHEPGAVQPALRACVRAAGQGGHSVRCLWGRVCWAPLWPSAWLCASLCYCSVCVDCCARPCHVQHANRRNDCCCWCCCRQPVLSPTCSLPPAYHPGGSRVSARACVICLSPSLCFFAVFLPLSLWVVCVSWERRHKELLDHERELMQVSEKHGHLARV